MSQQFSRLLLDQKVALAVVVQEVLVLVLGQEKGKIRLSRMQAIIDVRVRKVREATPSAEAASSTSVQPVR